ncbi:MAG: hypothetical protein AMXMBFR33_36500 [Candidatus Xenobia bacterium]
MDQLLQQLRREGKLTGHGDWTLDAETALDKLRFQSAQTSVGGHLGPPAA